MDVNEVDEDQFEDVEDEHWTVMTNIWTCILLTVASRTQFHRSITCRCYDCHWKYSC